MGRLLKKLKSDRCGMEIIGGAGAIISKSIELKSDRCGMEIKTHGGIV